MYKGISVVGHIQTLFKNIYEYASSTRNYYVRATVIKKQSLDIRWSSWNPAEDGEEGV